MTGPRFKVMTEWDGTERVLEWGPALKSTEIVLPTTMETKQLSVSVRELSEIANEILEAGWAVTPTDALRIAARVQTNLVLERAFLCDNPASHPVALEAIAMALAGRPIGNP